MWWVLLHYSCIAFDSPSLLEVANARGVGKKPVYSAVNKHTYTLCASNLTHFFGSTMTQNMDILGAIMKSHTILCVLADALVSICQRGLTARRARAFVYIKRARLTDFAERATFGYLLFGPSSETNNPEMWKAAILSLAVALSTAQGTIAGPFNMSIYH